MGVDYDDVVDDARARGRAEVRRLVQGAARRRAAPSAGSSSPHEDVKRASSSSGSGSATRPSGPATTRRSGSAGSTSRCTVAASGLGEIARVRRRRADEGSTTSSCCGMGGSSLAPEVLRRTFERRRGSTSSTRRTRRRSARLEEQIDLERTLFVSASKSGSTLETRSHTDYFWEKTPASGAQLFVAITDPGSELERSRRERGFRRGLLRRAVDRRPLLGALAVRDRPGGADGHRRRRLLERAQEMREALPLGRRQPGLRARQRVRRGLARGPRQDLHRRHAPATSASGPSS